MASTGKLVILATGGTIAGTAARADDAIGYTAAQLGVRALVDAVPPLAALAIECEQVAQLDSKDMDIATWQLLAERCAHHLARSEVDGVVVTHGTDTLEETAWLLHRVLAPRDKPVVLTAAMRPATALSADGPANLWAAACAARDPRSRGVLVALGDRLWAGSELRKLHGSRLDAFSAGDAGALAAIEGDTLRWWREPPAGDAPLGLERIAREAAHWPRVEVVTSHAGADGTIVDALLAQGNPPLRGLVVAGTGNGTLHRRLEAALLRAQAAGVAVLRSTRCIAGPVLGEAALPSGGALPSAGALTPAQARVELLLRLLA